MSPEISSNSDTYAPPFYQFNGHLQTIIPGLFRWIKLPEVHRKRWEMPDGDFVDVDWYNRESKRLVILCHGLEGDSRRPYILGMVRTLISNGFNALAWNFRSCSGEINRLRRFYHSGATDDLDFVVRTSIAEFQPEEVFIIGFSLGGNITLKYLGEHEVNERVRKAVAISVPVHLASSCKKIMQFENRLYELRFLRSLKSKVIRKEKLRPGTFNLEPLKRIRTLWDFDDVYTGPVHGFKDAEDYYGKCSSIYFLKDIKVPTLLLNARNDPFLSDMCFPSPAGIKNPGISFNYPAEGGHCGFYIGNHKYHSEDVALEFLSKT